MPDVGQTVVVKETQRLRASLVHVSSEAREARFHKALEAGVNLYNAGRFFEAHEVWEDVWLEEEGDDKTFLQGIIKIAAAFHHYGKGTYRGMRNLLRAGREMLEPYRPSYQGVELAHFLAEIEKWIPRAERLITGDGGPVSEPVPPLVYDPAPEPGAGRKG